MSLTHVCHNIEAAKQGDNHISREDAERILSRDEEIVAIIPFEGVIEAVDSVGSFVDKDEYEAIKKLYDDVTANRVTADPAAQQMLKAFVDRGGPDSRLGLVTKSMGAGIVAGGGAGAVFGLIAGPFEPIFAGIGAAAGGLLGLAHALGDD